MIKSFSQFLVLESEEYKFYWKVDDLSPYFGDYQESKVDLWRDEEILKLENLLKVNCKEKYRLHIPSGPKCLISISLESRSVDIFKLEDEYWICRLSDWESDNPYNDNFVCDQWEGLMKCFSEKIF